MKKNDLILLLLFAGCIWISGCGDKIALVDPDNLIMGRWKLIEWYNDTPLDIDKDGKSSTDLLSQWNGCFKQSILEFSDTLEYAKLIYTGQNNNLRCPPNFNTNDFFGTGPWKIAKEPWLNNQSLTFIGDDWSDTYEIMELSTTTLILKGSGFITCCDEKISYYTDGFLKFVRVK
jgi:hypothetical protein